MHRLRALRSGSGFCRVTILGGSWDLVSKVIRTLIGVIGSCKYSYLTYNPSYLQNLESLIPKAEAPEAVLFPTDQLLNGAPKQRRKQRMLAEEPGVWDIGMSRFGV